MALVRGRVSGSENDLPIIDGLDQTAQWRMQGGAQVAGVHISNAVAWLDGLARRHPGPGRRPGVLLEGKNQTRRRGPRIAPRGGIVEGLETQALHQPLQRRPPRAVHRMRLNRRRLFARAVAAVSPGQQQ